MDNHNNNNDASCCNSPPSSPRTSHKKAHLPTPTVEYLKNWMMSPEHVANPYPTAEERKQIMQDTGIAPKQLGNWFVNNRKRYWKPIRFGVVGVGDAGVTAATTTKTTTPPREQHRRKAQLLQHVMHQNPALFPILATEMVIRQCTVKQQELAAVLALPKKTLATTSPSEEDSNKSSEEEEEEQDGQFDHFTWEAYPHLLEIVCAKARTYYALYQQDDKEKGLHYIQTNVAPALVEAAASRGHVWKDGSKSKIWLTRIRQYYHDSLQDVRQQMINAAASKEKGSNGKEEVEDEDDADPLVQQLWEAYQDLAATAPNQEHQQSSVGQAKTVTTCHQGGGEEEERDTKPIAWWRWGEKASSDSLSQQGKASTMMKVPPRKKRAFAKHKVPLGRPAADAIQPAAVRHDDNTSNNTTNTNTTKSFDIKNSYNRYVQVHYKTIRAANPHMAHGDAMKLASKEWRALTDGQKSKYQMTTINSKKRIATATTKPNQTTTTAIATSPLKRKSKKRRNLSMSQDNATTVPCLPIGEMLFDNAASPQPVTQDLPQTVIPREWPFSYDNNAVSASEQASWNLSMDLSSQEYSIWSHLQTLCAVAHARCLVAGTAMSKQRNAVFLNVCHGELLRLYRQVQNYLLQENYQRESLLQLRTRLAAAWCWYAQCVHDWQSVQPQRRGDGSGGGVGGSSSSSSAVETALKLAARCPVAGSHAYVTMAWTRSQVGLTMTAATGDKNAFCRRAVKKALAFCWKGVELLQGNGSASTSNNNNNSSGGAALATPPPSQASPVSGQASPLARTVDKIMQCQDALRVAMLEQSASLPDMSDPDSIRTLCAELNHWSRVADQLDDSSVRLEPLPASAQGGLLPASGLDALPLFRPLHVVTDVNDPGAVVGGPSSPSAQATLRAESTLCNTNPLSSNAAISLRGEPSAVAATAATSAAATGATDSVDVSSNGHTAMLTHSMPLVIAEPFAKSMSSRMSPVSNNSPISFVEESSAKSTPSKASSFSEELKYARQLTLDDGNPFLKIINDEELLKKVIFQIAMHDNRESKQQSGRSDGTNPSSTIGQTFFWRDYPVLEDILYDNLTNYSHSLAQNSTKDKLEFNNELVANIRQTAEQHGLSFDPYWSDDKILRDRVRCFYKTNSQNAKKRLATMLKHPESKKHQNKLRFFLGRVPEQQDGR